MNLSPQYQGHPSFLPCLDYQSSPAIIFSVIGILNKDKPGQVESFFSPAVDVVPVGFIDKSGLITQPDIDPQLVAYQDEQKIKQDLAQGKISGYYVVPANYLDSGELTFVKEDFNPLTAFDQSRDFQRLIDFEPVGWRSGNCTALR